MTTSRTLSSATTSTTSISISIPTGTSNDEFIDQCSYVDLDFEVENPDGSVYTKVFGGCDKPIGAGGIVV